MKQFPQTLDLRAIEQKWQSNWKESGIYSWDPSEPRENNFVIDTPPPTVSGLLHMGHVFSFTQLDIVARYQRMKGKNVFFPMGFDDNGLPTERLVEKVKDVRATTIPRDEFVKLCQEVVQESEEEFRKLFLSIAMSIDWAQEYQTINARSRKLSQMSFIDLYNKGHIYRAMEPNLWDPVDQTALAQAEIEDKERKSIMYDCKFGVDEHSITISTTRPELLPACVAIMVHPDDERYKHLHGHKIITPLFGIEVPVITDEAVKLDKGTGAVMCCTFGDITDVHWWKIHKLPLRNILSRHGTIINLENIGNHTWQSINVKEAIHYADQIKDKKIKEARTIIVENLRSLNLISNEEEITQVVKCAERSGAPLEIIVTPQWFIRVLDKKDELLARAKECKWHPEYMQVRLENWIKGLQWDWCISRQRFFGVPFPVWYSKRPGEEGKIIIADIKDLPSDPIHNVPEGYSRDEVEPDMDVMDTWATSSISPQLNSHAINDDLYIDLQRHKKLFPADLRPQGHEIIRTWTFSTVVKAHLHDNTIPWKNIMISGWCLAADKTKMSKSKGNTVTPVNLIEEKGADIIRYWTSTSRLGSDIAYSESVFQIGKKLINKLWNAAKFSHLHISKKEIKYKSSTQAIESGTICSTLDIWLLSRLKEIVESATNHFEQFEYCMAREVVEDFFWNDLCDFYLEMIKTRVYNEQGDNTKGQESAIACLYFTILTLVKLFAPIIPHITEEIYHIMFDNGDIQYINQRGAWPESTDFPSNNDYNVLCAEIKQVISLVRKFKTDNQLSLNSPINIVHIIVPENQIYIYDLLNNSTSLTSDIKAVANTEKLIWGEDVKLYDQDTTKLTSENGWIIQIS